MKNRTLQILAAILLVFTISCQNSGNNTTSESSQDKEMSQSAEIKSSVKAELEDIKDKSNDLMEDISNATYAERKNLQDDIQYFVDETSEKLTEMKADSELEQGVEKMLNNIEDNTNILVEELKEFGDKTEEEWEETTSNLSYKIKEIGEEIDDFFNN